MPRPDVYKSLIQHRTQSGTADQAQKQEQNLPRVFCRGSSGLGLDVGLNVLQENAGYFTVTSMTVKQ